MMFFRDPIFDLLITGSWGNLWPLLRGYPDLALALLLAALQLIQIAIKHFRKEVPKWLDSSFNAAIVILAILIVRFQYSSAVATEGLISSLRTKIAVAQSEAEAAIENAASATTAATTARSTANDSKKIAGHSLTSARLALTAAQGAQTLAITVENDLGAQRRALRSMLVDVQIEGKWRDPRPPSVTFEGGEDAGQAYLYNLDTKDSTAEPITFSGSEFNGVTPDNKDWHSEGHLHLLDRGAPVGGDTRAMDGYKLLCIRAAGLLEMGITANHRDAVRLTIFLTVNGNREPDEASGELHPVPYLTPRQIKPGEGHLECVELQRSVADIALGRIR